MACIPDKSLFECAFHGALKQALKQAMLKPLMNANKREWERSWKQGLVIPLCVFSMLANFVMVWAMWEQPHGRQETESLRVAAPLSPNPFWSPPRGPKKRKMDLARFAGAWQQIESPDYNAFVQNLRAVECPEAAIRNILLPRIDADFEKRKDAELAKLDFWRSASEFAALKRGILPRLASIETEKHQTVRNVLHTEGCATSDAVWLLVKPLASSLPEMEFERARSGVATFVELVEEAQTLEAADSDFIRVENLERVKRSLERFKQGVSPELLSEALRRMSGMPSLLAGVELSADELRELCRLRAIQRQSDLFRDLPLLKLAVQSEDNQASNLAENLIRGLLGAERYAAYHRDQDERFQRTWTMAQAAQLPFETAVQAYDQVNLAQQALTALSSDPTLSPEVKQAAMNQLAETTRHKLKALLGDGTYKAYAGTDEFNFLRNVNGSVHN